MKKLISSHSLERFRSRWRRWLGNKTRLDKPYYLTLLDTNWLGWAYSVYDALGMDYKTLGYKTSREDVKTFYLGAINAANMAQLFRLDGIYAGEKIGL
jgi:hypothetical protein